ncbi:Cytochrome c, mono-and diheme variants [Sulfitobacter brevis]|uniref:Cytochrome c, mono-and diheme variants n=1 Tax=Sulfitobacter brevis TaxID=74348 RepID=A0A1I1UAN0_9RHOB|nr:cytochrome c [Sulfitobacter brevis]SFD66628.1 Cytochrome c, mono-and diheme variants [Sulfitobacter brevis]
MIRYIRSCALGLAIAAGPVAAQVVLAQTGEELYQENCASCHGATLEGEPNWRERSSDGKLPAPPHDETGHTWHHADRILTDIIKRGTAEIVGGGYESNMPGFADVLTDAQIEEILGYIKSTWPDRARTVQEDVTRGDIEARE